MQNCIWSRGERLGSVDSSGEIWSRGEKIGLVDGTGGVWSGGELMATVEMHNDLPKTIAGGAALVLLRSRLRR